MIDSLLVAVYALTNALLWPVVLVLLAAVARSAFLVGELAVEARERRAPARALKRVDDIPDSMAVRHGIREWLAQRREEPEADVWLLLDRTEAALAARVDRARLWVRLGPALGLAGTLIPLGPALMALAENDLTVLSERLTLAFGTTVLGLLAGGLCWVVLSVQDRWYRLDLAELRHALDAEGG
ncbi:MAG: MotA/TolQ/ExbB proton channel family protein [bacterium]